MSEIRSGSYDAIALDLDGTCLNDRKQIDEPTVEAIRYALQRGKDVLFCSGRGIDEVRPFLDLFPEMRYVICESGGYIYDLSGKRVLFQTCIGRPAIEAFERSLAGRDVMPNVYINGRSIFLESQINHLPHYMMAEYAHTIPLTAVTVTDVFEAIRESGWVCEKFNMYHTSMEERTVTKSFLDEESLGIVMVDAPISSLECTPAGVDKALGLRKLAETTGLRTERIIMVGDAGNDIAGLRVAGLAVAMGNATDEVRAICDVMVADNNHNGCAEAIYRYLLNEDMPAVPENAE